MWKKILVLKFQPTGKINYYTAGNCKCNVNDYAIVDATRGMALGKIIKIKNEIKNKNIDELKLKPIIRVANKHDIAQYEANKQYAESARKICIAKAKKYKLNMRVINVEYTFDRKKVIFYFSTESQVDFRALVKELSYVLKSKIEMRQINVREQTKMLGGIGICGRPFCCSTFLNNIGTVSIKMAKQQNLSLNPNKLSGACGRLMCCIQYEQKNYEYLIKHSPHIGDEVETPDGRGRVVDINLLTGFTKVDFENKDDVPVVYHKDDIKVIK